jgi:hypothetical protein
LPDRSAQFFGILTFSPHDFIAQQRKFGVALPRVGFAPKADINANVAKANLSFAFRPLCIRLFGQDASPLTGRPGTDSTGNAAGHTEHQKKGENCPRLGCNAMGRSIVGCGRIGCKASVLVGSGRPETGRRA